MNSFLEVREYDTIIHNEDYADIHPYLNDVAFRELEEFVHAFTSDEGTTDVLRFLKIGYRRGVGDTISVSNYVGLIQTKSGCQIQVLPKIDFKIGEEDKTKKIFIRMLRSSKNFSSKIFTDANLNIDRMNLYEIFIQMYIQESWSLVKHGLKADYAKQEGNLTHYKGKLKVKEHLRYNLLHQEKLYVVYDEFVIDRAENRIVKATLEKLQQISKDIENVRQIRQLLTAFEMVHSSVNYAKDFSKVVINRGTKEYEVLMQWSKVFLHNNGFTSFSGDASARAILFPMEKVFESYVAKELRRRLDSSWDMSIQDRGIFLFDAPLKFALQPDIVLTKNTGKRVILDTKWKRLCDNANRNYGISQSDMYQMFAYAEKYATPDIWLLYPDTDEMNARNDIVFDSYDGHANIVAHVRVFFVNVADIEESLLQLIEQLEV